MNQQQQTEPRLPQIDPITYAALNTIDGFLARAPLTRQEHLEANKGMQHLVQTLEILQATVRQTQTTQESSILTPSPSSLPSPEQHRPQGNGRITADAAEEIFRNAK